MKKTAIFGFMAGALFAYQAKAQTSPSTVPLVSESYTAKEIRINYGANNIPQATIIAVSDVDTLNGGYKTGSKQETLLQIAMTENERSAFGAQISDTRLQNVDINYSNPSFNNLGQFSARIYANTERGSKIPYVGVVDGNSNLNTGAYGVTEIKIHTNPGQDIPIIIDGKSKGNDAAYQERDIESKTTSGKRNTLDGLSMIVQFVQNGFSRSANVMRKVIPADENMPVTAENFRAGTIQEQMQQPLQNQNNNNRPRRHF